MTENQTSSVPSTQAVQEKHQVDISKLQTWMETNVESFTGTIEVSQFSGGQSNPTFLLEAGGKTYVMRRKPPGQLLRGAHAVDREYKVLTALGQTDVPVPRTYALCTDEDVLGTWFYIMDYCEGRIFWAPHLEEVSKGERAAIYEGMVDALARLHNADYKDIGLQDFGREGNYVARQINTWSKQYRAAATEEFEPMERLLEWLPENIPADDKTTVIHGDFRLDNMIFHPTEPRVIAILDWELSTLGNPLADFNYNCLPYSMPLGGRFSGLLGQDIDGMGIPSGDDYIAMYCERTGRSSIDNWDFYTAFNMFRLSAIAEGIMVRIKNGTAASAEAMETAKTARPLAERAWGIVESKLL